MNTVLLLDSLPTVNGRRVGFMRKAAPHLAIDTIPAGRGVDLTSRPLNNAEIVSHMLPGACITMMEITGAKFNATDLYRGLLIGSTFESCSFRSAKLVCADLTGATFVGCDLTDADLRGTNLSGTDLSSCMGIDSTVWNRGTRWNEATDFPPGFDPKAHLARMSQCASD